MRVTLTSIDRLLSSQVSFANQSGDHMRMVRIKIVVRTVNVRGYHAGEHRLVLWPFAVVAGQSIVVRMVQYVDHTFRIGIAEVRLVRRTVVYHTLGDRVAGLVGKDTGGQARDAFAYAVLVGGSQNVVVHLTVQTKEVQIVCHVGEQTAYFGAQMNHVRWLECRKNRVRRFEIGQISVGRADELELAIVRIAGRLALYAGDRTADQTGTASD